MPKRTDIKKILIIGAGPIVIGQACEFDYSGVQACKALKDEGYEVVLVNSNPATIMTDPEFADATYIEPVTWQTVAEIIEKERPDALLPTMGGQTALNTALSLAKHGVLEKYQVELIGASKEAIDKAEDRELFAKAMAKIGLFCARSEVAHNLEQALASQKKVGFPTIIRPSFTLGGSGGGIAYNIEEFVSICEQGFDLSPTQEILIEESVIGWKEFEMEVVRDKDDNCIIVCAIENFDPMGVHTGDSITVAPAQTLTDKEYQELRNASIAVLREIGVDTGGSNVQFAISPHDGRILVIEMNPRVSRSSALASKATGFPIAKVAAKLAVGYTLPELKNEITAGKTPISFEPSIDYIVTKIPRFNFEKFPQAEARLSTQMKSVGEVMAMGRTFQESLQKALRGLEIGIDGLETMITGEEENLLASIRGELARPGPNRIRYVADAFRCQFSLEEIYQLSHIDRWFLVQIEAIVQKEEELKHASFKEMDKETLHALKQQGFADSRLAALLGVSESEIRRKRWKLGVRPVYKRVDTCAGEFPTETAYFYSTYETECEARPTERDKIMVLGGGPNRIGQGIEFDYCCVHASMALQELGFETIMVNCNPETVSTDYDTSDRLYFEPLTLEDVLEIVAVEKPKGVIVQYGGQTPLKLAKALEAAGVPILGTSPEAIDRAEDRERFQTIVERLNLKQPPNRTARTIQEGLIGAKEIGYPLVVRPSYVLGGRAMEIVYNEDELSRYFRFAVDVSHESPVLLDHFLDDAIEVDLDLVADGQDILIGGIMEHIEQAGVHSGDSSCSLPAHSLSKKHLDQMRDQAKSLADELGVIGLMNMQFAVKGDEIFVLEVNPRASRTIPFVSKTIGVPLAKVAAKVMAGVSLKEQNRLKEIEPPYFAVKEAVFPFKKFAGVDPILGPEMKSTGEVMGLGLRFSQAYYKAELAANNAITKPGGRAFLSVRDQDKSAVIEVAKRLIDLGFKIIATSGTHKAILAAGLVSERVNKMMEGRPHIADMIKNGDIQYIVNSTEGKQTIADSAEIRRSALQSKVIYTTTVAAAKAACIAMAEQDKYGVCRLQDWHARLK